MHRLNMPTIGKNGGGDRNKYQLKYSRGKIDSSRYRYRIQGDVTVTNEFQRAWESPPLWPCWLWPPNSFSWVNYTQILCLSLVDASFFGISDFLGSLLNLGLLFPASYIIHPIVLFLISKDFL